ncbi:MAG: hemerythrin domain-containing protein [Pseudomonadota bacterium]|jgi:hypothetical protein
MFGFLFRKNGAAHPADAAPAPAGQPASGVSAPGTAIHYSADLIARLKADHAQLLALYGAVKQAFANKDYAAVAAGLEDFRSAIQGHLLVENVRLYIYLEHQLAQDPASFELIHEFRREMDGIGKAVVAFLTRYRNIGSDRSLSPSFAKDLDAVGAVLVRRIEREEATLYPLYLPGY